MPNLSIKLHHMYVGMGKKHSIYMVWYNLQFQASTGGVGMYAPWMRENYSNAVNFSINLKLPTRSRTEKYPVEEPLCIPSVLFYVFNLLLKKI